MSNAHVAHGRSTARTLVIPCWGIEIGNEVGIGIETTGRLDARSGCSPPGDRLRRPGSRKSREARRRSPRRAARRNATGGASARFEALSPSIAWRRNSFVTRPARVSLPTTPLPIFLPNPHPRHRRVVNRRVRGASPGSPPRLFTTLEFL